MGPFSFNSGRPAILSVTCLFITRSSLRKEGFIWAYGQSRVIGVHHEWEAWHQEQETESSHFEEQE